MKKIATTIVITLLASIATTAQIHGIYSMGEVAISELPLELRNKKQLIAIDKWGDTIVTQSTYDGKVIFPILKSKSNSFIIASSDKVADTAVCGAHYPERLDDIAWENNLAAYRAYGPALQRSGERAFGYDVWTKREPRPIVKERYFNHLHKNISYHTDHGNGMDVYAVGASLGCGTAALYIDSTIVYPYCWSEYKILDNGPWRFTVELRYNPTEVNEQSVTEVRTITLDYGTYLNKTIVRFEELEENRKIAAGIVVHSSNPDGYYFDKQGIITVEDSTQSQGNGAIYVGLVKSEGFENCHFEPYKRDGEIAGHILGINTIAPNKEYIYYWGAGWSKNGITKEMWHKYMKDEYNRTIKNKKIRIKTIQ